MIKPITELDRRLQEMALLNWQQFTALVGEDAITGAKICMLRQKQKSYGEIMLHLRVSKQNVRTGCKKCEYDVDQMPRTSL